MEGVVSRRPAHAENSRCAALALPIPYGPSPSFLVYEPQQLTPVHQFFRALLLRRLYDHFDQTSDESCRSHLSSVWHELRGPTLQVQVFSKERKAPRLCNSESRPRGTWPWNPLQRWRYYSVGCTTILTRRVANPAGPIWELGLGIRLVRLNRLG